MTRTPRIWNATNPYAAKVFRETEGAAQALDIEVKSLEVRPDNFESVIEVVRLQHPDALITVEDPLTVSQRKVIADFAATNRMPAIHGLREFVEVGGLMSYGTNLVGVYRGAATYVDKILRGAKPADLPVQQPTKFELVINLKAARDLGITLPPALLARADVVIE
jgi:putative ABC transport system substrate-binding protein